EGGERAPVGHGHLLRQRHPARGARAPGRHVHLAARGTALAHEAALRDAGQEAGEVPPRRDLVPQAHPRLDLPHRVAHGCASKQAMSWIEPVRRSFQRTRTRMPVRIRSGLPASTAWSRAVSAPSRRISAQAKGRSSGWRGRGSPTQAQVVTVPVSPTGTKSAMASPAAGSCSTGGTNTFPAAVRAPSIRPSRRPDRNLPITGPTLRRYVYAST